MPDESKLEEIANRIKINEVTLVRSLTVLGLVGLAAIPFLGWFGLVYSGAIGSGLLGRYFQRKPRHAYSAQRILRRKYREEMRRESELLRNYN